MQINLLDILKYVYERDIERLDEYLIKFLSKMSAINSNVDDSQSSKNIIKNNRSPNSVMILSRALEARLLGPEYMSFDVFSKYIALHRVCQDVLYSSSGTSYRKISKILAVKISNNKCHTEIQKYSLMRKLAISHDLGDPDIDTLKFVGALQADERGAALVGYLSGRNNFDNLTKSRRISLAEMFCNSSDYKLTGPAITHLSLPYMYVSYWGSDSLEAALKKRIGIFLKQLNSQKVLVKNLSTKKQKPKIAVVAEAWGRSHAMYRCYKNYISSLKEIGEICFVSTKDIIERSYISDFDCVEEISPTNFMNNLEIMKNISPDAIYFPSIGMSFWSMMIASNRIAPYQFATLGHPSFPYIDTLDNVFISENISDIDQINSQKSILKLNGRDKFYLLKNIPSHEVEIKNSAKISITAMVAKLSFEFIEKLVKIKEKIPRIQYHFHIADQRMSMYRLVDYIYDRLPDSIIDGYLSYDDYIDRLSTSSISITTTPFGHTNSLIDSLCADVLPLTVVCDNISSKAAHAVFGTRKSDNIITFDNWESLLCKLDFYINSHSARRSAIIYAQEAVNSSSNEESTDKSFQYHVRKNLKVFTDIMENKQ